MNINKIIGFYIFILEKPLEFKDLKWFYKFPRFEIDSTKFK
jgi:hypothetical protein